MGFVNDEALDSVEAGVGGDDLLDAQALGNGKVERIVGQQAVLLLQLEGDVEVFGPDGFNAQFPRQEVAGVFRVDVKLPDELGSAGKGPGRVRSRPGRLSGLPPPSGGE